MKNNRENWRDPIIRTPIIESVWSSTSSARYMNLHCTDDFDCTWNRDATNDRAVITDSGETYACVVTWCKSHRYFCSPPLYCTPSTASRRFVQSSVIVSGRYGMWSEWLNGLYSSCVACCYVSQTRFATFCNLGWHIARQREKTVLYLCTTGRDVSGSFAPTRKSRKPTHRGMTCSRVLRLTRSLRISFSSSTMFCANK